MLGSFKLRLLLVIIIATLVGLALQSDNRSHRMVSPVIKYVMRDYGVEEKLTMYLENMWGKSQGEGIPTSGDITMQKPCSIIEIEQHYGWYWNEKDQKQEFNPGLVMRVKEGTLIKPVLAGKVNEITSGKTGRKVTMVHNDGLISIYEGLEEVLVKKGTTIKPGQILGKTGEEFYFELQNSDGPLNPESIFDSV